ncbi:MAG TPA: FtsX-like permease family protein [Caulobacteraceae bacterium]|nr:FtsX-like permease family protein [Caulobacteraceae bacterium]
MTPLSVRFALRELRAGVRGFRIFLACLALGVAAIAAAGSTAEAFRQGLAAQAAEILGGDIAVGIEMRPFSSAERTKLERLGRVSYSAAIRAMAQAPSGERRLVELRGVSANFPLLGQVTLGGGASLARALAPVGDAEGVAVEQTLLDRLGLKLGDRFLIGNAPVVAKAVLIGEPDRLSRGFALGARVLARHEIMTRGGFFTPGLPVAEMARIQLRPGVSLADAHRQIRAILPHAQGFRVRDRDDAAPGFRRLIDQLEYFLGFIGLSSLIAGGLGVSGAVDAYLEARKPSIATLKALGADGALARNVYLIQIGVLAALGIGLGLVVGAAAPLVLGALVKDQLPVPALFAIYPAPLARAAAFGALAAAAFSLAPLGRARSTPPAALFRQELRGRMRLGPELIGALAAGAGLSALAVLTAPTRLAAAIMIGGVAAAFVALFLIGIGAARLAGWMRGASRGPVRIGLANLAGPHSAARTAAPAIGLGVALLAMVVLIQSSLVAEVTVAAPKAAPAMVFTEIPGARAAAFDAAVAAAMGRPLTPAIYQRFPFLTGRITGLRGMPVDEARIEANGRWAFDADLALTAIGPEPPDAGLTAGRWWPANYAGPPEVALEAGVARAAGLKVGDALTLSLLGRDVDARIAALRKVDFGGFGPDFTVVIDPAALAGATLRQVAIAKATPAEEARVTNALGASFPAVDVISVREQLEAAASLFDRLTLAVRGAAAVAGLAGLLVLAGAIAAGARARAKEAATLKVLGAARWQILAAYAVEYGAVGAVAGLAGVALGYAAAWPVVVKMFEATWSVDWAGVAALIATAAAFTGVAGLLAALHALARRPAPVLRAE